MTLVITIGVICVSKVTADCSDCTDYGNCIETTVNATCAVCVCPSGFSGDCCEVDAPSLCSTNPCGASGTNKFICTDFAHGLYSCTCQPGWTGTNCDTTVDGCNPSPCASWNTNSCNSGFQGNFTCNCKNYYTGTYCQSEFH